MKNQKLLDEEERAAMKNVKFIFSKEGGFEISVNGKTMAISHSFVCSPDDPVAQWISEMFFVNVDEILSAYKVAQKFIKPEIKKSEEQ